MTQKWKDVALPVWSPLEDNQASQKTLIQLEAICFLPSNRKPNESLRDAGKGGSAALPLHTVTRSLMAYSDTTP